MARPSKIDRLPPEIREEIGNLRGKGYTLEEILAHLRSLDMPPDALPSRSGLGRHIQGLDKLAERLHRSRTVAEALVKKFGDAPEGRQARLNIELMHSIVTDLVLASENQEGEEGVTFSPDQVMFLASALRSLASAAKTDADLQAQIRKQVQAEMKAKIEAAAADVGKVAKEAGLSAERIFELQSKVAGLRVDPGRPLG